MREYVYNPKGVCSSKMQFIIDGDIIKNVKIIGGCSGNSQGISQLLIDMSIDDAIKRLRNIKCGFKSTSCPDQLAVALEEYKKLK